MVGQGIEGVEPGEVGRESRVFGEKGGGGGLGRGSKLRRA